MNNMVRKLRLGRLKYVMGLLVLLAGFGNVPAEAKQPTNAAPLLGTWVNIKTTGGLVKVVITDVSGNFEVHPYGSCSPTLFDWVAYPVLRFSTRVASSTGFGFQLNI